MSDNRKLFHFRLRKDEEDLILNWLEKQSNLSSAFRYLIKKEVVKHGIQDLAVKAGSRTSEEQALNDVYYDTIQVLNKLKEEQKLALYFKLQSEVADRIQGIEQVRPPGVNSTLFVQSHPTNADEQATSPIEDDDLLEPNLEASDIKAEMPYKNDTQLNGLEPNVTITKNDAKKKKKKRTQNNNLFEFFSRRDEQ